MRDNIPAPKDDRHRKFADLVLQGNKPPEAYRKAGFKLKNAASARTLASRLLRKVDVATYMNGVRTAAVGDTVLSVTEKREFLARIVRTPLMSIDPHHPERKDGDLILKYKRTETETGGHEEIVKLDPLKAIAEDNRLSGDDPEANAVGALAEAFAQLAQNYSTLPTDRM